MTNEPPVSLPEEVLSQNPKVNTSIVAAHERLEQELRKLGVEIKSSYNIEPAFGRRPTRHRKQTRIRNYNHPMTRNS